MALATGNTTITFINRDTIARMVKESGLTYLQLESLTGIPHSALQRYVAGTTEKIPMNRVQRLVDVLQKLGPGAPNTPNDQDHLRGEDPMVTLNDLLALVEVKRVTIYAPATPRIYTRVDFDPQDSAILDDVTKLYGHLKVKTIGPIYKGDERLVVKLGEV